jgi:solute carrier family 25 (mitochondrial carnitine/acylcarnitine transporter), member 20/29
MFITLLLLLSQHLQPNTPQFGNMVFFGSYEYFKRSLPKLRAQLQQRQQHSTAASSAAAQPDHASIALAGGLAGMSFWGSVHPIDLVKSLIQTDNLRNPRFSGMADCFRQVVAERGLTGMYRSVLATHTIMVMATVLL